MLRFFLFFLFIVLGSNAHADMGASYKIKAIIKTLSGTKVEGYYSLDGYDFYLEQDSTGYFIAGPKKRKIDVLKIISNGLILSESNDELSDYLYSILGEHINVYSDVINIPCYGFENIEYIPRLVGSQIQIEKDDIIYFEINEIIMATPGVGILSELVAKDKIWTKSNMGTEYLGSGFEHCSYYAVIFTAPTPITKEVLKQLKRLLEIRSALFEHQGKNFSDKINDNWSDILKKVEALYSDGILITQACSC